MILTFILAMVAAILAPVAEPHVRKGLDGFGRSDAPLTPADMRVVSFAACLLGAAILAALISTGGVVPLALGALVGALVPKLLGF